ncbi:MAG: hypothetical protein HYV33_03150 [Candidatus Kerfeldbacteria bacterium]|nr:hypothetical protein [Candidatus Kerfeldbacteria bacterium]
MNTTLNIRALSHATSATMVSITALTISAEEYAGLKNALTSVGSHHWIGKGIVAVAVFVVVTAVLQFVLKKEVSEQKSLYGTLVTAIVCMLILPIFFIFEYFK